MQGYLALKIPIPLKIPGPADEVDLLLMLLEARDVGQWAGVVLSGPAETSSAQFFPKASGTRSTRLTLQAWKGSAADPCGSWGWSPDRWWDGVGCGRAVEADEGVEVNYARLSEVWSWCEMPGGAI